MGGHEGVVKLKIPFIFLWKKTYIVPEIFPGKK